MLAEHVAIVTTMSISMAPSRRLSWHQTVLQLASGIESLSETTGNCSLLSNGGLHFGGSPSKPSSQQARHKGTPYTLPTAA